MKKIQAFLKYLQYPILIWLLSVTLGSIGYSIYTAFNSTLSDIIPIAIVFYFIHSALSSLFSLVTGCLLYTLLRYNEVSIFIRKTTFILLILGYSICDIVKQQKAFIFDKPPYNILSPLFEGSNLDFWLIYSSVSIFFILVLKDNYKKG
jgi:hypothetical protein